MKKFPNTLIILAILSAALLSGCKDKGASPEWAWNAERPEQTRGVFSHEVHKGVLEAEGLDCFACHPMNVETKDEKEIEELIRLSDTTFYPGKETCHFCHYNPESGNIGPGECKTCHLNINDIQPPTHNFNWLSKHTVYAKGDLSECETCHKPNFCQDCHERRDLPTRRMHDRNFIVIHAIEARANPRECASCHEQKSFCQTCHIEGGYDK